MEFRRQAALITGASTGVGARKERPTVRPRIARMVAGGTALVTAVAVAFANPMPASAIDPGTVITIAGYVKTAYDKYNSLVEQHITLDQATTQILNAITTAQTQILHEIDAMAAADIQSCARSAVIEFSGITDMTVDRLQQYVADTTKCVTDAWAKIPQAKDNAAVDEMGFALNIVGPIALAARSKAYGPNHAGTLQLRDTVIQANQSNLVKLQPNCGGVRGEIVNGQQEVALICTAYNGDTGDAGTIFIGAGQPIPTNLDYSVGITQAVARTSSPVSVGALDGLLDDPTVTSPGNQGGYFNDTANLQLTASGAAPPYTWRITGLPPGLTSNPSGLITGTFIQAGTWTVRATATDTQAQSTTVTFTWTVATSPPSGGIWGSSVALARNADGRLEMFGTDAPNQVYQRSETTAGSDDWWSNWFHFTDSWLAAVAMETNVDGRIDAYGVNGSGAVFQRTQTTPGGPYGQWTSLGNEAATSIAAAKNADGHLEIFITTASGDIWHNWQPSAGQPYPSNWSQGFGLPGTQFTDVASALNTDGMVELFATDRDGGVWHRRQDTTVGWGGWTRMNAPLFTRIAAAAYTNGTLALYGVGLDRQVQVSTQTAASATTWTGWAALGSAPNDVAQIAARNGNNLIELVVVDASGSIWKCHQTTSNSSAYTPWTTMDGTLRAN